MSLYDDYINKALNPVLSQLTSEILRDKPENPIPYLIELLNKRLGTKSSLSEKEELRLLRQEMARLKLKKAGSEEEKTSSDEDEVLDELEEAKNPKKQVGRSGVSAEAYGNWNKKEEFKPKIIPKSQEQYDRIVSKMSKSFMFAALDDKDKEIVIGCMQECVFSAGSKIINQGEDGSVLYFVDSGELSCYKKFGEEEKYLKDYFPGETFGELALLYNAPRAATIISKTDSILWSLDRECFNNIVKDAAIKRRETYEEFLIKVDLLADMDPYERIQLADALVSVKFNQGEFVIKEGEEGNNFYIIVEGQATATKKLHNGQAPTEVKRYGPGDYFGELSLLKGDPRAANVVALEPLKCVSLDRHSFKRLLGPVESILQRNAKKYEEIIAKMIN